MCALQGTDQVVVNNLFHSLNAFGVGMMDGASDDLYVAGGARSDCV